MLNKKASIVLLIVRLIKKKHNINEWMFPEPKSSGVSVKVELYLSALFI